MFSKGKSALLERAPELKAKSLEDLVATYFVKTVQAAPIAAAR